MIRLQLRRLLLGVLAVMIALGNSPAAADDHEPTIRFYGGGWGHGIGMSQYGAYGRAVAGHSYEQILAHYYEGTGLQPVDDFGELADDTVNVRVDVRSSVAVSTPLAQVGDWEVEVFADGASIGTSTRPVTATWNGSRWTATWTDPGTDITIDLCENNAACASSTLAIALDPSERTVLEEWEDGPNLGEYRSGRIVLHPASVTTAKGLPTRCGSGTSFCVVHEVGFDEYLYGIAEVPTSWPDAAMAAQAVAARSYAASRIIARNSSSVWPEPFDVYEGTADQVYSGFARSGSCGGWCAAVDDTERNVVTYDDPINGTQIAETFYSSSNGGYSAEPPDVWANGSTRPYLQAAPDEFDGNPANPNAARVYEYSLSDVSRWLNSYDDPITGDQLHVGTVRSIEIDAPASGRVSFASVVIHGTSKSTSVEDRVVNGSIVEGPYGFRFYSALREGCLADAVPGQACLKSTNFTVDSVNPFVDVEYDDYFYLPVQWMTVEDITKGVAPAVFGPQQTNNRAQLATFLWRFAGEPVPTGPSGFTDVQAGSFYEDAVAWMRETDITTGTSPTQFSPEGTVTRGQAAAFLWRFAGEPESSAALGFNDVPDDTYYTDAVRWMVEWEITTGTSPTTFSPDAVLTRAQIATFLWRLAGQPDAFADDVELPSAMRVTT
jgi:peptidoglycan hydrolase-like amidase